MIGESRFLSRGSSNIIRANWMSPARHCQFWLFSSHYHCDNLMDLQTLFALELDVTLHHCPLSWQLDSESNVLLIETHILHSIVNRTQQTWTHWFLEHFEMSFDKHFGTCCLSFLLIAKVSFSVSFKYNEGQWASPISNKRCPCRDHFCADVTLSVCS